MSAGVTREHNLERGSRQSGQLEDILDDANVDALEAFDKEVIQSPT